MREVVFELSEIPAEYDPRKCATREEFDRARAYYSTASARNYVSYMTANAKRNGEYGRARYARNPGPFDLCGIVEKQGAKEFKSALRTHAGSVYAGFVSFHPQCADRVDSVEKCADIARRAFPGMYSALGLRAERVRLICALHTDREHLHVHFLFFEEGASDASKLDARAMRELKKETESRIAEALRDKGSDVRYAGINADMALKRLIDSDEAYWKTETTEKILGVARALPDARRKAYASLDMSEAREAIDGLVGILLAHDAELRDIDRSFYGELAKRRCAGAFADPRDLEAAKREYEARRANSVIELCARLKPMIWARRERGRAGNKRTLRNVAISRYATRKAVDGFVSGFRRYCRYLARDELNIADRRAEARRMPSAARKKGAEKNCVAKLTGK